MSYKFILYIPTLGLITHFQRKYTLELALAKINEWGVLKWSGGWVKISKINKRRGAIFKHEE